MLGSLNSKQGLNHLGTTSKSCMPRASATVEFTSEAYEVFNRLNKWHLQSIAREVLFTKGLNGCCRTMIPQRNSVDIIRTKKNAYRYKGLMTCGSVWKCPVCASKISGSKRFDLFSGMNRLKQQGCGILMLTVTVPHRIDDSITKTTDGISTALRNFFNHSVWQRFSSKYGILTELPKTSCSSNDNLDAENTVACSQGLITKRIVGRVRSLEVTFGIKNGWHPHFHILLFTGSPITETDRVQIEQNFFADWKVCCRSVGLGEPDQEHGLTLVDGTKSAKYILKQGMGDHSMPTAQQDLIENNNNWQTDAEKTTSILMKDTSSGHVKDVETYTPFGLLQLYADGDKSMGRRFAEYADCFHGRRQLVYSPGLRRLMSLDKKEKTDIELAAETDRESTVFASITPDMWKVILSQEKRGIVLEICRSGIEAVEKFILDLTGINLHTMAVNNEIDPTIRTIGQRQFVSPMPRNKLRPSHSAQFFEHINKVAGEHTTGRIFKLNSISIEIIQNISMRYYEKKSVIFSVGRSNSNFYQKSEFIFVQDSLKTSAKYLNLIQTSMMSSLERNNSSNCHIRGSPD